MKTTRFVISHAVARLVEGKLADRESGTTPMSGDVYSKMVEAGIDRISAGYIEVNKADCVELAAEMDFALDGERELTIGERAAAKAMRDRAKRFAEVLA